MTWWHGTTSAAVGLLVHGHLTRSARDTMVYVPVQLICLPGKPTCRSSSFYVVILLFTSYRNKRGRVVKSVPFQDSAASGEVARIEPNKKWFGKSCIVMFSVLVILMIASLIMN